MKDNFDTKLYAWTFWEWALNFILWFELLHLAF